MGILLYLARDRPDLLFCRQRTQQFYEPPNFDSNLQASKGDCLFENSK